MTDKDLSGKADKVPIRTTSPAQNVINGVVKTGETEIDGIEFMIYGVATVAERLLTATAGPGVVWLCGPDPD